MMLGNIDILQIARLLSKAQGSVMLISAAFISWRYWRYRKHRKNVHDKESERINEEMFERDENGLFPWEVDTDHSPERVGKQDKPVVIDSKVERGKW